MGAVEVSLLSDEAVERLTGHPPAFPEEERRYRRQAHPLSRVVMVDGPTAGMEYVVIPDSELEGLPESEASDAAPEAGNRKKAIVTRLLRLAPLRTRPVLRGGRRTGRPLRHGRK